MASETNNPVWQPPVPMGLFNFLSYAVAAEYAANKLQRSVNFGVMRENGMRIAQYCTEIMARAAYVKGMLSVKSSLKEPDQYTGIVTLGWPGFPDGMKVTARLTQPQQKGGFGNDEEVATLFNDLTRYLGGVDEATPVTLEHIARRLGNRHFTGLLYKPYNL